MAKLTQTAGRVWDREDVRRGSEAFDVRQPCPRRELERLLSKVARSVAKNADQFRLYVDKKNELNGLHILFQNRQCLLKRITS